MINESKNTPIFRKYDFGKSMNKKLYGAKQAPEYDLTKISVPVRGIVCMQDSLGDTTDNSILNRKLVENGVNYKEYLVNGCDHMTYMLAKDISPILDIILKEI